MDQVPAPGCEQAVHPADGSVHRIKRHRVSVPHPQRDTLPERNENARREREDSTVILVYHGVRCREHPDCWEYDRGHVHSVQQGFPGHAAPEPGTPAMQDSQRRPHDQGLSMQTYPSMTSVNSMLTMGHLPPGHGYVPKKVKPDKPYGPSFISVMNRTWRGPGQKYINYALVTFCFFLLFILAAGLYIGHRNVNRLRVLNTEVFGALFVIIAILLCWLMFHFILRARQESNKWRATVRYRAEGLCVAAAYNSAYNPENDYKLQTGTYGRKALRELPKPRQKGAKGRSRAASRSTAAGGLEREMFEKKGPPPQQSQYPPPQGQYPPPQGQYPPPQGQYPPPQGQYPPPQGQYPPPQGQYPPPQGQYPPPQGPPVEGMYAQVHKKPKVGVN